MVRTPVRTAVRYALMACAAATLASPAALSQTAPTNANQDQAAAPTTQLGTIEVTGTRIRSTDVETAQPITLVTAQQIRQTGLTTVGEVLQNITQSGASLTRTGQAQGTSGASTLDLRYFGSSRVLILINGRRWTPQLSGSVDLSTIPSSMIDHVEILQDGASAIYGSDAITGVVNIITIQNFNGAEAHAYMGMYDNNYGGVTGWDGRQQQYDFTIGSSGERMGAVVSVSYNIDDGVPGRDRAQTREPVWGQGTGQPGKFFTESDHGFYLIQSPQLANLNLGQATCSATKACGLMTANVPAPNPSLDNFANSSGELFNKQAFRMFDQPTEGASGFYHAHYNIADNLTFTSMGAYNRRSSVNILYPDPWDYGSGGFWHADGKGVGIGANNPYNPFGVDLVGNLSQYCPDGHTLGGVQVGSCTPNYLLSFYELDAGADPVIGNRVYGSEVGTMAFRADLNGFFEALGSEWDWDAGYSYGNTLDTMTLSGFADGRRIATQFDSPGFAPCNGPAQSTPGTSGDWTEINGKYYQILQPGCVPFNPFGGYNSDTGVGTITPGMAAYSAAVAHDVSAMTMRDYSANITGAVANMPAGPLSVALGAESLEEDGYSQPDPLHVQGNLNDNQALPTSGRKWTRGEYVEFSIPIVKSLSMDLANRWSQFTWAGGNPGSPDFGVKHGANSTTARAQMRWQPSESLLLRGSWAQGFRAPSISNLYAGAGLGFPILPDPCAPSTANGGWNQTTPLPPGCHGLVHTQPEKQLPILGGGNPNLVPEKAISRSAGFVYSPDWLAGLTVGADYYKIDLTNSIGTVGSSYILDQCYLHDNPQYCSHVTVSGGIITQINNGAVNVGESYSNGIDVNASYVFPATSIGNFRASTTWTFVRSFMTVVPSAVSPSGFQSIEQAGYTTNQIPKAKGKLGVNWSMGNWSAVWNVQYIGQLFERCTATMIQLNQCSEPGSVDQNTGTMGKNHLGTTIYHDAEVTYHVGSIESDFSFGIRNLFNKQFPASLGSGFNNSFAPSVGYRVPGRFVYGRIGVKF